MIFSLKKTAFAGCAALFLLSNLENVKAFGVRRSLPRTHSLTVLQAERESRRRDLFNGVRRIFLGAGAVATLNKESVRPAFAEETTGKIIEMEIANIEGEAGKTGTIKIQLRPEWAPRGVARFEVGNFASKKDGLMYMTCNRLILTPQNCCLCFFNVQNRS